MSFRHEKYWTDEKSERVVEPYALKEFEHRWYLLAKEYKPKDGAAIIKTYGLDRISNLDIKSATFTREEYHPEEDFRNSFGIIAPENQEPEEITLTFDRHQGNYIKALPLHHSQKLVAETEHEITVRLFLIPTYDFERQLLCFGDRVTIKSPESLRKRIKDELQRMISQYN